MSPDIVESTFTYALLVGAALGFVLGFLYAKNV